MIRARLRFAAAALRLLRGDREHRAWRTQDLYHSTATNRVLPGSSRYRLVRLKAAWDALLLALDPVSAGGRLTGMTDIKDGAERTDVLAEYGPWHRVPGRKENA